MAKGLFLSFFRKVQYDYETKQTLWKKIPQQEWLAFASRKEKDEKKLDTSAVHKNSLRNDRYCESKGLWPERETLC